MAAIHASWTAIYALQEPHVPHIPPNWPPLESKWTPNGTPMANAMLTLLHKLGMDDVESFGDSTEPLSLSVPEVAATF